MSGSTSLPKILNVRPRREFQQGDPELLSTNRLADVAAAPWSVDSWCTLDDSENETLRRRIEA
jgi:hypothetical protein